MVFSVNSVNVGIQSALFFTLHRRLGVGTDVEAYDRKGMNKEFTLLVSTPMNCIFRSVIGALPYRQRAGNPRGLNREIILVTIFHLLAFSKN